MPSRTQPLPSRAVCLRLFTTIEDGERFAAEARHHEQHLYQLPSVDRLHWTAITAGLYRQAAKAMETAVRLAVAHDLPAIASFRARRCEQLLAAAVLVELDYESVVQ